jgi:flagellar export protein FliJ
MTSFRFRLEPVLRLRSLEFTIEKDKLHQLLAEAARLERSLASVNEERAEAVDFVRNRPEGSGAELRSLSAFLVGSDARATALRESIQRLGEAIAAQQARARVADRNERQLVKLKDKQLADWRAENDRELEILAHEAWLSARANKIRRFG